MKKVLSLVAIVAILLVALTGCVNVNYEVELEKNGSANVSYTYEVDKQYLEDAEYEKMKERATSEGYSIEEYTTEENQGFKASKHFDNASDVSLEKVFGSDYIKDSDANKIKVEKQGFDKVISQDAKLDLSTITKSITVKYTIKLPAAAQSNNANEVSEDGKTLTWNLISSEENSVQYSTTVKGFPVIPVVIAVVAIVVVACIVAVVLKSKKTDKVEVKEEKVEEPKKEPKKATKKTTKKSTKKEDK